ncbi:I78 family peptidase inhibitor [Novosphingobium sp. PS1R-30]|uniref:I78 family peptidase inhibitor n=1 Tax=Novosphingobium anseongense TaxID=3133436 RepID=A0ABU8RSJ2_9SPHN
MMRPIPLSAVAGIAMLALSGCTQTGDRAPTKPEAPAPAPAPTLAPAVPPSSQPAPPSGSPEPKPGAERPPQVEPVADACGAGKLVEYLNLLPTDDTAARIRLTVGHDRIRTIRPGDAVTQDFRPDRLNVEIGEDGRIKRVYCS